MYGEVKRKVTKKAVLCLNQEGGLGLLMRLSGRRIENYRCTTSFSFILGLTHTCIHFDPLAFLMVI
jgi:hypothetical protein